MNIRYLIGFSNILHVFLRIDLLKISIQNSTALIINCITNEKDPEHPYQYPNNGSPYDCLCRSDGVRYLS